MTQNGENCPSTITRATTIVTPSPIVEIVAPPLIETCPTTPNTTISLVETVNEDAATNMTDMLKQALNLICDNGTGEVKVNLDGSFTLSFK